MDIAILNQSLEAIEKAEHITAAVDAVEVAVIKALTDVKSAPDLASAALPLFADIKAIIAAGEAAIAAFSAPTTAPVPAPGA